MTIMSSSKRTTLCAACIALCYVLPIAFHSIGLGSALSPMHIPVLLCGLICGGGAGILCGLIGPVLSSLLSGMPPVLMLVRMIPELCTYGLVAGIAMKRLHTGSGAKDVYISMIGAMVAGRIVGGIATAVFFAVTSGVYSVGLWFTSYFVEAIPGIVVHLVVVPVLYFALQKARLIPNRYAASAQER